MNTVIFPRWLGMLVILALALWSFARYPTGVTAQDATAEPVLSTDDGSTAILETADGDVAIVQDATGAGDDVVLVDNDSDRATVTDVVLGFGAAVAAFMEVLKLGGLSKLREPLGEQGYALLLFGGAVLVGILGAVFVAPPGYNVFSAAGVDGVNDLFARIVTGLCAGMGSGLLHGLYDLLRALRMTAALKVTGTTRLPQT